MAILIVEDSPSIAHMLIAVLKQGGFDDTIVVSSGEELFDLFNKKKNDGALGKIELVLLDLVLPGVDGLEVCRTLKKKEEFAHTPVVVVTAKNDIETMEAAFAAGAWDFLVKPVNGPELVIRIKAALAKNKEINQRLNEGSFG